MIERERKQALSENVLEILRKEGLTVNEIRSVCELVKKMTGRSTVDADCVGRCRDTFFY